MRMHLSQHQQEINQRKQLIHLCYPACFYYQEAFSLPYTISEKKMKCPSWNPGKFPFHFNVAWAGSHSDTCKRPQNTGENAQYSREICDKDLVLIIQHSFPNLSIYLHIFMIFIVISMLSLLTYILT